MKVTPDTRHTGEKTKFATETKGINFSPRFDTQARKLNQYHEKEKLNLHRREKLCLLPRREN